MFVPSVPIFFMILFVMYVNNAVRMEINMGTDFFCPNIYYYL